MDFDRYAGMASAVGIVLILTIVAWLNLWGPIHVSAIKEWQTLIGFGGTLAVGAVAWVNVSRQISQQQVGMRLSLLTREEDRIEVELPGLKDAALFCESLVRDLKKAKEVDEVAKSLSNAKIAVHALKVREVINGLLPDTDDRRRLLIARVQRLVKKSMSALLIYQSGTAGAPLFSDEVQFTAEQSLRYDEAMNALHDEIDEMAKFGAKLRSEVRWMIRQASRIRSEIESRVY